MPTPASSGDAPLTDGDASAAPAEPDPTPANAPARPPAPVFKFSTLILTFMFVLGLLMLFDTSTRNGVATELGYVLQPAIGFGGRYVLLTMFLAAVIEMNWSCLCGYPDSK